MPYADKAKNDKCKRDWDRFQRENKTDYFIRKQRRISKRKHRIAREQLKPRYIRSLLKWPGAPDEIVRLKRAQIQFIRTLKKLKEHECDKNIGGTGGTPAGQGKGCGGREGQLHIGG